MVIDLTAIPEFSVIEEVFGLWWLEEACCTCDDTSNSSS